MGRFYKTKSVPFIDYGYDYPYKELVGALEYKQGRQDKSVEALMKAQDALSKVDYVPGTEHEKYLKQKREELSNQVNQLSTQDLSGSFAPVTSLINDYVSDPTLLDIQRTAEHVKAQEAVRQDYIAKGLYHENYEPLDFKKVINEGVANDSWRAGIMSSYKGFDQSKADAARRSYFNDMTANQKAFPGAVEQRARDNGLSYALTPLGDQQMRYEGKVPSNMTEAQKEEWGIQALMQQAPEFDNYLVGKTKTTTGGGGKDDAIQGSIFNTITTEALLNDNKSTTVASNVAKELLPKGESSDQLITSTQEVSTMPVYDLETGAILPEGTGNVFQDTYNRNVLVRYDDFIEDSEIQAELGKKAQKIAQLEREISEEKKSISVQKKAPKSTQDPSNPSNATYASTTKVALTPEELESRKKELQNFKSYANNFEYLKETKRGKELIANAKADDIDLKDAAVSYNRVRTDVEEPWNLTYKEWKGSKGNNPLNILSKVLKSKDGNLRYKVMPNDKTDNLQYIYNPETGKHTTVMDAIAVFDQQSIDTILETSVDENGDKNFKNLEDLIEKTGLQERTVLDSEGKPAAGYRGDLKEYTIGFKKELDPTASQRWEAERASGNVTDNARKLRTTWDEDYANILNEDARAERESYVKQKRDFEISKFGKNLEELNSWSADDADRDYNKFITDYLGEGTMTAIEESTSPTVNAMINLFKESLNESMGNPQTSAKAAFIGTALKEIKSAPGTNAFKTEVEFISNNILNKIDTGGDPNDYLNSAGTGLKDIPLYKTRAKNQALSLGLIEVDFENILNINMTDQVYAPYASSSVVEGLTAIGKELGSPIDISGLYRTPSYNNAISHTKKTGVHTQGRGVDVAGASMQILLDLFAKYKNMDGTYNRQKLLQDFNLVDAINEDDHLHLEFK